MNEFFIDRARYEILVINDVDRDGLGLELWDKHEQKLILEIFRYDKAKRIGVSFFKSEIPLELVKASIVEFENSVGRDSLSDV